MPDDLEPANVHPGEPALPDLGGLLGMAMDLQQQMAAAQAEAATAVVEGQAGGGAVRIEVTGGYEFRSVRIDPDAVDPDDVDLLQDLVLAALNDAAARVAELHTASDPLAAVGALDGFDLGGLAGAFGLGGADEPAPDPDR